MKKILCTALILLTAAAAAQASITFIFNEDEPVGVSKAFEDFSTDANNNSTGSVTQAGLTITARAGYDGGTSNALFNATGGNEDFGINIDGDGSDESDKFDGGLGDEFMVFSFDKDVYFNTLDLSGLSYDSDTDYEAALFSIAGGSSWTFTDDDGNNGIGLDTLGSGDAYTFSGQGVLISAGTEITLKNAGTGTANDNGWRLDSMEVTVVPEPATIGLLAIGAGLAGLIRRFRTRMF